jgi:hypothetical protein
VHTALYRLFHFNEEVNMGKTKIYQKTTANPLFGWLKLHGFLALAGIAGPLLLLGAELLVPLSFVNYSPLHDSISMLAWAGMGWLESATFLIAGLLLETFAAALLLGIRGVMGFSFGIVLLTLCGFSLLMVGLFRTDIPYFPPTIDGTIHGIASKVIFILLPLAILLIAPSLKKDPYWNSLFSFSIVIACFALIWIGIYKVWEPEELGLFGLYERVLVSIETIWIEVMAFWLLRLFLRSFQYTPDPIPVSEEYPDRELANTNTNQ